MPEVDEHVEEEHADQAGGEQEAEAVAGGEHRADAAVEDRGVEREQRDRTGEAPLLGQHGEDEIARMLRHEVQLRLRAVVEAAPEPLAVADGDLRLVQVVAGALRIGVRIEEDEEPRALKRLEHRVGPERRRGDDEHAERVDAEVAELRQPEEQLRR